MTGSVRRDDDLRRAIAAVWRDESAAVVATLARMVGDVGRAEDFAQDALVEALRSWPRTGLPARPGAWLVTVGRRRIVDAWRRDERAAEKYALVAAADLVREETVEPDEASIDDDVLRLVFVCCHPVLPATARSALALRVLCGLTTEEIARAYLVPSTTMGQRIARAKRSLASAHVPFEVPDRSEFDERLGSVLEVIYLLFNEGHAATGGEEWMRPPLAQEALRLGRLLTRLMPREPETHGLLALMELTAARFPARRDADGAAVPLPAQDRALWDRGLIERGMAELHTAERVGGHRDVYTVQAAIAGCHARAATAADTDWSRISALYDELAALSPTPVVLLNRAVAVGMAAGPEAGLRALGDVAHEPALAGYAMLSAARGDLLERLGRGREASAEFARASALTANAAERSELQRRAARARESARDGRARADPPGGSRTTEPVTPREGGSRPSSAPASRPPRWAL